MLSVSVLNMIMLSVAVLNIIMLSIVVLSDVMFSVMSPLKCYSQSCLRSSYDHKWRTSVCYHNHYVFLLRVVWFRHPYLVNDHHKFIVRSFVNTTLYFLCCWGKLHKLGQGVLGKCIFKGVSIKKNHSIPFLMSRIIHLQIKCKGW